VRCVAHSAEHMGGDERARSKPFGVLSEFRQFIVRGNLVDLAVAVVIGTAFGAVVTALVRDLLTPLIAAVAGEPDFSSLTFTVNGSQFLYGDFLNALLAFLLIATVVFFLVVKPVNALMARYAPSRRPSARPPSAASA
jgi:large conductance mechanosensitive channel